MKLVVLSVNMLKTAAAYVSLLPLRLSRHLMSSPSPVMNPAPPVELSKSKANLPRLPLAHPRPIPASTNLVRKTINNSSLNYRSRRNFSRCRR